MLKKIIMILGIIGITVIGIVVYIVYSLFNQLGDPVDKEISDSYYYSTDGKSMVYSPMGNWFELGKTSFDGDVATFSVLARDYGKDKDHVYYKSKPISNEVDIKSFVVKDDYIPMDKNHVYVVTDNSSCMDKTKACLKIIEGADPATYKRLNFTFTKDKAHVFCNDTIVSSLDTDSFEVVSDYFSKDKGGVYLHQFDAPLKKLPIDPDDLMAIAPDIIRDSSQVYIFVGGKTGLINIPFRDSSKIQSFAQRDLLRIDDVIYYQGVPMEGADAETFEIIDGGHFKDKNKVFFWGELIEEADVNTFEIVKYQYAKDKDHVFFESELIENADPASFRYNESKYRFEDKNNTYQLGKPEK